MRGLGIVLAALLLSAAPARAGTLDVPCADGAPGLVAAVASANTQAGPDTITLERGCTYAFLAADNHWFGPNAIPAIASAITIDGRGARIERSPATQPFRLFFVGADPLAAGTNGYTSPGGGALKLRDLTVSGGLARGGGGFHGGGGGAGLGGAIFNMGAVTLERVTLAGNTAHGGGGGANGVNGGGGGLGGGTTSATGGGFGGSPPSDVGAAGGAGGSGGGGGGAGLRTTETGGATGGGEPGPGGGPHTGTGGFAPGTAASGNGAGAGAQATTGGAGGAFGAGGGISAGGGVGGGGGGAADKDSSGGGGGFGGGGGGGNVDATGSSGYGGGGGFGGGAGGNYEASQQTSLSGGPGFGGGFGSGDPAVGSTFGGGGAGMGGAIFNLQGTLSLASSTLSTNTAVGGAGGSTSGAARSGEPGNGFGGAIFNLNGSVSLLDTTLGGNVAVRGDGAIDGGWAIYTKGFDLVSARNASVVLRRSIVAYGAGSTSDVVVENTDYSDVTCIPGPCPPVLTTASVDAADHDLVMSKGVIGTGTFTGSPITADPRLAALGTYRGGLTPTRPPTTGSPAQGAAGTGCPATDQIGQPRPGNGTCDIGSVETYPPANDDLAAARAITGTDVTVTGDDLGATHEASEPDHAGAGGAASTWFRWTAPAAGNTTLNSCPSAGDRAIAVYTGTGYGSLQLVTSQLHGCDAPAQWTAVAGTTYLIALDGATAAEGITGVALLAPASGDSTPPDTVIDSGPSGPTNDPTPSFAFHATEPGSGFECSVDQGVSSWVPCDTGTFQVTSALADGEWTFRVRATDPSGNTDLSAATRTLTVDTSGPVTVIDSGPSGTTSDTRPTFTFHANEAGTFACSLDQGTSSFAPCDDGTFQPSSDLANGGWTFRVRATDPLGNTGDAATRSFTVDTSIGPDTSISPGPASPTNATTASFDLSSPQGGVTFECRLDGAAFAPCSTPVQLGNLTEGSHTFQARARDTLGNPDATPASWTWTIDLTPPDTDIFISPFERTPATTAHFQFGSDELGSTFRCKLDDADFAACTSPLDYDNLAEGQHTFIVAAVDAAGNPDPDPASHTWTIDPGPDTSIDSGPPALTNATTATFTFSSPEPGVGFRCSLDGGGLVDCTSPTQFTNLAAGQHSLLIRAEDAGGYPDQDPPVYNWTIDLTAPATTIDSGPDSPTSSPSHTFTFSSNEPGATFRCKLDDAAFATCSSPKTYGSIFEFLPDGQHTFQVQATDAAGNVDPSPASHTWTTDTAGPAVSIDSGPPALTNATTATFLFSSPEEGATFECQLAPHGLVPCTSPAQFTDLAEGQHNLTVRAVDALGNPSNNPPTHTWTIDLTPPDTAIASGPEGTASATGAEFTFTSTAAGSTFRCKLDDAAFAACTSPHTYALLADGVHTFQVAAVDPAGNEDTSPATRSWTIALDDTPTPTPTPTATATTEPTPTATPTAEPSPSPTATTQPTPTPTVTPTPTATPAATPDTRITRGPRKKTRSRRPRFRFSSTIAGSTFECKLDRRPFTACRSGARLRKLKLGRHKLRVRAVSPAGVPDPSPAKRRFRVLR